MFCSHTIRCFIVVDGAEGGTGAAPEEFSDHMGMALRDGLILTRNALVGTGLRSTIRIGVTTQNPSRQRGLVVEDKYRRVANYHRNTLRRLGELVGAAGLEHPGDLCPHHLHHRTGPNAVATMDRIVEFLPYRALLDDPDSTPYAEWWAAASPDSFQPLQHTGPG